MRYNFDTIIDRKHTDSIKWDYLEAHGFSPDTLPLWVADMDFRAPTEVQEALVHRSTHGIFGYSEPEAPYYEALRLWFSSRHHFDIKKDWVVKTPGVVCAIIQAIYAFTEPGDGVMIQTPVYHPFFQSIKNNGRRVVDNALCYKNGRYTVDFDNFEALLLAEKPKLFLLCSPHNPVGRVWTRDELMRMGELCCEHGVIVVADEIHCDFTYPGHEHHVFQNLDQRFEAITITCTAPSKTFNLAGLCASNIIIANENLRRDFSKAVERSGTGMVNAMGLLACQAAYTHGQTWLDELKVYLQSNLDFTRAFMHDALPELKLVEPEGTYLVWIDFSGLHMPPAAIDDLIRKKARLWLDSGIMFGSAGSLFQRINIACPKATLNEALQRLAAAIHA